MNFNAPFYYNSIYQYAFMMNYGPYYYQLRPFESTIQFSLNQHQNYLNFLTERTLLKNHKESHNFLQTNKQVSDQNGEKGKLKDLKKKNIQNFVQEYAKVSNKKNKNMNSNILTYFTVYIKDIKRMRNKFLRLITRHQLKIDIEQLPLLIQEHIRPKDHYCNPSYFYKILHGITCPQQFAKFIRIALLMFVKHDLGLFLRKTPKMKRISKIMYLQGSRLLIQKLLRPNNLKFMKKIQ